MKFVDKHIEIDKLPKKFKKMTATRFAAVLGLNSWKTPFAVWCGIGNAGSRSIYGDDRKRC